MAAEKLRGVVALLITGRKGFRKEQWPRNGVVKFLRVLYRGF